MLRRVAIATDDLPVVPADGDAVSGEVAAKDLPAFSIALIDGNRVVWAAGFGFAAVTAA